MKISFLLHHFESGGTENIYLDLIRNLTSNGHECSLILFQAKGVLLDSLPEGVKVYGFNTNIDGILDFVKIYGLSAKIAALLNRIKPDIVYSGLWINNLVNVLACKGNQVSFPVTCIISDHINTYASMCYEIKYKTLTWLKKLITKHYYNLADCVVCVSKEGMSDLIDICGSRISNRVRVIYNGIDIDRVQIKSEEPIEDIDISDNYIITVGRISYQKGLTYLLQSFKAVTEHFNDLNLLILGDDVSPEKCHTSALKKLSSKLGLSDKVVFAGYRSNPYKYIKKARCLVSSSLFEGFGLVLVESMAIGTPVIATRCKTGPAEILGSETSSEIECTAYGAIVLPKRPDLLQKAIIEFLRDEPDMAKCVENSRERVNELFSLNTMYKSYEELFREHVESLSVVRQSSQALLQVP
ncbi:glycosyltransferase [Geobacter sp. DSM 9736]|uniref:glycosyltransferase n=1 Tax=Geobacter sp. DSM 9736 TaxID=1277350 RepID=UPI000B507167|nr:glycosyltransferase [Geobacter sp. DSM 9736]SNB45828.1 Glycosyltransferase involved in cell wall bisynthesis [Geobacter sp. DSM 9736]